MAHTPGPWAYRTEDGYCGEIVASNGTFLCAFADDPSEANARLIAAAPDLLDALSVLLAAVQRSVCEGSGPAQDLAHAAIAKAAGGAA